MKDPIRIVSTKKLQPEILRRAALAGLAMSQTEMIRIDWYIDPKALGQARNLLDRKEVPFAFSSANAVLSLKQHVDRKFEGRPVYSISGKTLESVRTNYPEMKLKEKADSASDLANKILQAGEREILFLCGNLSRDEIPSILGSAGCQVHQLEVYHTSLQPVSLSEDYNAVLFFSPSAVEAFFQLNRPGPEIIFFAIGNTTAQSLHDRCSNRVIVSKRPGQAALMDEVEAYYKRVNSR